MQKIIRTKKDQLVTETILFGENSCLKSSSESEFVPYVTTIQQF